MSKKQKTEDKDKALHISDVINKKIRYKDGSVCKIVGGNKEVGLLNEWESGSVSGFGKLEDIVEVFN